MREMDGDVSFDLSKCSQDVQTAYARLRGPPCNLKPHSGGSFKTQLDKEIHTTLQTLILRYEPSFPDVVDRVIQTLSLPSVAAQRGRMHRIIPVEAQCLNALRKELARCQEEALMVLDEEDLGWEDVADDCETLGDPTSQQVGSGGSQSVPTTPTVKLSKKRPSDDPMLEDLGDMPKLKSPREDKTIRNGPTAMKSSVTGPCLRNEDLQHGPPSTATSNSKPPRRSTDLSSSITATSVDLSRSSSDDSGGSATLDSATWKPRSPLPDDRRVVDLLPRNPYQSMMDYHDVKFAVQWEMERLISEISSLSWADVHAEHILKLKGSVADILPRLPNILSEVMHEKGQSAELDRGRMENTTSRERRNRMYFELDKEEESLENGDLRGLGNDSPDWPYGGKVSFTIRIQPARSRDLKGSRLAYRTGSTLSSPIPSIPERKDDPDNPMGVVQQADPTKRSYTVSLGPPDMQGKSFRLARRFGSRRIVSLKYKSTDFRSPKQREGLVELLSGRHLVLFGRVYRAMWAVPDGDSVYMIETGDHVMGAARLKPWDRMPAFADLLRMFNDLEQKPSQAMAKWAARPQILFSDTVPAFRLEPDSIAVIPDIVTLEAQRDGSASTEQILTDGCGLMSPSVASRLRNHPHLKNDGVCPSAVQIRINGAKGLLAIMSEEQEGLYPGKDVVLRHSMIKSIPASDYQSEPSHFILDIVRCGFFRIGATISSEPIIALVHGGVPARVFVDMISDTFEELRRAFDPRPAEGETKEDVLLRLVASSYRRGGAGLQRKQRDLFANGKSARAAGAVLGRDDIENREDRTNGGVDVSERYDVDPISGQSGSIAEALMDALMAGFHPLESYYTHCKLHFLIDTLTQSLSQRFQIPLARSLSAFIEPDSKEILHPDEIFVSFPNAGFIDPDTGAPVPFLEGPVLAFRSPCKLPTDVRKFNAVYKPELSHLRDCIVLSASSVLCERSLASILAGGDYDGDTVTVIWEKDLVDNFNNASIEHALSPPEFESRYFEKEVVKGTEFLDALRGQDSETVVLNQQSFLLGAILDDKLTGNYSDYHGNAVYTLGYDHFETIRLARMFCLVLDARKSGLRVKRDVQKEDAHCYGGTLKWRKLKKGHNETDNIREMDARRPRKLGRFIMDILADAAKSKADDVMRSFPAPKHFNPAEGADADYRALSRLYFEAKGTAATKDDLLRLERHVRACHQTWMAIQSRRPPLSVLEAYRSYLCEEENGSYLRSPSKHKNRDFHSKTENSATDTEIDMLRLTQIRELAVIWRDRLTSEDVFRDQIDAEDLLKRLKVSCAAHVVGEKSRHKQDFPFDMDFITTCELKAKATGRTSVILDFVLKGMKPIQRDLSNRNGQTS